MNVTIWCIIRGITELLFLECVIRHVKEEEREVRLNALVRLLVISFMSFASIFVRKSCVWTRRSLLSSMLFILLFITEKNISRTIKILMKNQSRFEHFSIWWLVTLNGHQLSRHHMIFLDWLIVCILFVSPSFHYFVSYSIRYLSNKM